MRNFIPGKLARFAVLMVFVFLLAQSSVARAQGYNQQWFSSFIEDARKSGGWSDCQYRDRNLLECHTKDLSVSPVYASKSLVRPLKQSGVTLTAYGKNCWSGHPILIGEGCFVWSFEFDPAGGPVVGSYDFQQSSGNAFSESQGTIEGFFQGGDGGAISGTFSGQFTYGEPGVVETVTRPTIGTWKGNLYANGTGLGTYTGDDLWGDWSVQFDATAFQNALALGEENTVVQPSPDPYIDPNPDPEPEPVKIDPEVISILQSILGTPVVPITGAIAGGLAAWVISMLGGGRPVLPAVPRPPTGGFRPGQVGPDGKIWSPTGQGWVSKSMYDYQQKWLQKGWRWNSQTGQFEGQHGAVNENGQVQDDELGWVDQQTFDDNEQKRAQGYVYDRSMGWQTPEDSNRSKSDWDGRRQRERKSSADKNAEIQKAVQDASQKRQEEYQKWLKQYEHKEQVLHNMDAAQDEFRRQRAIDNKLALKQFLLKSAAFPVDGADAIGARMCPSIGEIYQGAYDGVKETASEIKEIYKEAYQGAYNGVKETASEIKEIYKEAYQGAYDGVKEAASDLKEVYQGAYDGVKEAASDLKDLVYHDGVQEELRKKLSGKISDWTTKFTKNAASKYTESPIKKQLFDTYGKPALQGGQGVGSTLKDKAFEAAAGDFPEKAVDLVMDQVEKHPELIR